MKTVFIISDATGETAERMVRAATLQFEVPCNVRTYSRVRSCTRWSCSPW
jgi:regulator of PEP synthase PpsR (kinase-PPPase family)